MLSASKGPKTSRAWKPGKRIMPYFEGTVRDKSRISTMGIAGLSERYLEGDTDGMRCLSQTLGLSQSGISVELGVTTAL